MLIDSHAHLLDERLCDSIAEIVSEYPQNDVEMSIEIGADIDSSRGAVLLASKYKNIYATVGMHPQCAPNFTKNDIEEIAKLAKSDKVVAIGEIGLDYHYDYEKSLQKSLLIQQILIADSLQLPVVLHLRDAYLDMESILNEYKNHLKNGVLLHCYSGSREMIDRFTFLDPYYAFGGAITFKNNNRADVIRAVKKDRLLIETDSPYLTPVPHRGKVNTPNFLKFVAERMADDLGMSYDDIAKITNENTRRFYRI